MLRASMPARVRLKLTRFKAGVLDDVNLRGGFKPWVDALKQLGCMVDDSPRWLDDSYKQVRTRVGVKGTRIEIEVLP